MKTHKPTTNPKTFNTQLNVLMESELNAMSKLSPELANRVMDVIERSLEYKKDTDNQILNLEKENLKIKEKDMRYFHTFNFLGLISFILIFLSSLGVGTYLLQRGYETAAYFSYIVALLSILPKFISSFSNKKS